MKIKNMKLMLLGLLAMGSMNAFAAIDEESRSVNDVLYLLETNGNNKTATVVGINSLASEANQKTISIPATVAGEHGTYKVVALKSGWEKAIKDVSAVTTSLSIDVTNFTAALTAADAFNSFTKLEALTITDSNAAKDAKTLKFDGSAANCKSTLKSLTISGSNINEIAANGCKGYTALETVELGQIKTIGANAFDGCSKVSSLTVPATVTSIGADAFANMYKAKDGDKPATGLQTLTFNANDAITEIPAAFAGDNLLKSVTITSAKATTIAAGAFTGAENLETLDLSGCTALTSIAGAFAASKFVDVKLAGTKLASLDDLQLTNAKRTLKSITFPAAITTIPSFSDFVALESVDLSNTKVTEIAPSAFYISGDEKDDKGNAIAPKLASVTLNAKTTKIGALAFSGQTALATVANLNQGDLTEIGGYAFYDANLSALDLSGATKLTTIGDYAFAENSNMATVALPASITTLGDAVFCYDNQIASINLGDLKKLATLPCLFQAGVSDEAKGKGYMDKLTTVTLPMDGALTTIKPGALQLLAIEEIVIPSTVTSFGYGVLQGCINLKNFTWEGAQIYRLDDWTFRGDDKLEKVIFATTQPISSSWQIFDNWFYGNDKDVLTVYVTDESYELLEANGWSEANAKYATLAKIGPAEYDFTEKALAADGYYYRTYVNENSATWFDANEVEVFGAVVEGANVVLKPAEVENGYYKVNPYYYWTDELVGSDWVTVRKTQPEASLCVIRSKNQIVNIQLKDLSANQISTLKENNLKYVTDKDGMQVSRLRYMYKLGRKDDQVKFWRCTSGKLNKGVIYLNSDGRKDLEFMDMIVEGEATAIKGFQAEAQDANAPIYNLQGIRVNKAQKGIYIQNGKKFIMK